MSAVKALDQLRIIFGDLSFSVIVSIHYSDVHSIKDTQHNTLLNIGVMSEEEINDWINTNKTLVYQGRYVVKCGRFTGYARVGKTDTVRFDSRFYRHLDFTSDIPTFDWDDKHDRGWNPYYHSMLPVKGNKLCGVVEQDDQGRHRFAKFFKSNRYFQFVSALIRKGPADYWTKKMGVSILDGNKEWKNRDFHKKERLTDNEIVDIRNLMKYAGRGVEVMRAIIDLYFGVDIDKLQCSQFVKDGLESLISVS